MSSLIAPGLCCPARVNLNARLLVPERFMPRPDLVFRTILAAGLSLAAVSVDSFAQGTGRGGRGGVAAALRS